MSISKRSPDHQRITVSLQDGVASYRYSWLLHPCKPYWLMPLGIALPSITHGATAPWQLSWCEDHKSTAHQHCMDQKQDSVNTNSITVPTSHTMNAPIHSNRNRTAVNMHANSKYKFVASFFSSSSFFFFSPLEIQILSTLFCLISVDNRSLRQFLNQGSPKQH